MVPKNIYFSPILKLFFRYGWLNQTALISPVSSLILTRFIISPLLGRDSTTLDAIMPSNEQLSPSRSSAIFLSLLLSS